MRTLIKSGRILLEILYFLLMMTSHSVKAYFYILPDNLKQKKGSHI